MNDCLTTCERVICSSTELVDGGDGVRFEITESGCQVPAFVVRYRDKVYGYLNRCAHVPVEMDWQPGKFFDFTGNYLCCTVHGALYAPESGYGVAGPCNGRGLQPLNIVERDNTVYLIEASE